MKVLLIVSIVAAVSSAVPTENVLYNKLMAHESSEGSESELLLDIV